MLIFRLPHAAPPVYAQRVAQPRGHHIHQGHQDPHRQGRPAGPKPSARARASATRCVTGRCSTWAPTIRCRARSGRPSPILAKRCCQPTLFEAEMRAAAEDLVTRLRARGFRPEAMQEETRKPAIATVDLDTLEHENPRTCERLCLKALDDLGFAGILHALGIKAREGRIASALIVARMVHPASERETGLRRDSRRASWAGRRPQGAAAQDALPRRRPPLAPPGRHPAGAVQP